MGGGESRPRGAPGSNYEGREPDDEADDQQRPGDRVEVAAPRDLHEDQRVQRVGGEGKEQPVSIPVLAKPPPADGHGGDLDGDDQGFEPRNPAAECGVRLEEILRSGRIDRGNVGMVDLRPEGVAQVREGLAGWRMCEGVDAGESDTAVPDVAVDVVGEDRRRGDQKCPNGAAGRHEPPRRD